MLRSIKELGRYQVSAADGDVGTANDFYFDDRHWTIRYLVVDAMVALGRRVLISPIAFKGADSATKRLEITLTREKVRNSPDVDLDKPVSRQHERDYNYYYGWPYYWQFGGPWSWGFGYYPMPLVGAVIPQTDENKDEPGDAHLRSIREVTGYHIQGTDDEIGHVEDFIVDDQTWAIRYLVVDTRNWWFGKKVMVPPRWADKIDWGEKKVHLGLPREMIKNGPIWTPESPIDRAYEQRLHDYYDRPAYWTEEAGSEEQKKNLVSMTIANQHRSP